MLPSTRWYIAPLPLLTMPDGSPRSTGGGMTWPGCRGAIGIDMPSIYGMNGIILVFALKFFPFIYLMTENALNGINKSLEDAAENLEFLQLLHSCILDTHVINGELVSQTGRRYPIADSIPNMLLQDVRKPAPLRSAFPWPRGT